MARPAPQNESGYSLHPKPTPSLIALAAPMVVLTSSKRS